MKLTFTLGALLLIAVVGLSEAGPSGPATTAAPGSGVTASKDLKDAIKKAKEAKMAKKDCLKACPANYAPLCAHDPADKSFKPRTFGNQCVLDTHNCEMGTKLVMLNKGECPGSQSVRL